MNTSMKALLGFGLGLGLALAGSGPARAQCFGPDNLNGPCWMPAVPNLPQFPQITQPGAGICWNSCTPTKSPLKIDVQMPFMTACDQLSAGMTVTNAGSGALILAGTLVLDYTRTWDEADPAGLPHQVWRFAAKADLGPAAPGGVCPVPPCAFAWGAAFFYGYVDYSLACGTNQFQSSLVLFHNCDKFIHAAGLSSRPGVFHPGQTYAIVAPDTAANPFVPVTSIPPSGPVLAEALRTHSPLAPVSCVTEEPIQQGIKIMQIAACACPLLLFPPQVSANLFNGLGVCPDSNGNPSSFASLNLLGFGLPWFDMITTSIGNWTTAASYPGPEVAWVNEGFFVFHDSCAPNTTGTLGETYIDMFYGGETAKGWQVLPHPIYLLTDKFTDLASNFASPASAPVPLPVLGSVMGTRHLIYTNTP
jgi:hypothetical protein